MFAVTVNAAPILTFELTFGPVHCLSRQKETDSQLDYISTGFFNLNLQEYAASVVRRCLGKELAVQPWINFSISSVSFVTSVVSAYSMYQSAICLDCKQFLSFLASKEATSHKRRAHDLQIKVHLMLAVYHLLGLLIFPLFVTLHGCVMRIILIIQPSKVQLAFNCVQLVNVKFLMDQIANLSALYSHGYHEDDRTV